MDTGYRNKLFKNFHTPDTPPTCGTHPYHLEPLQHVITEGNFLSLDARGLRAHRDDGHRNRGNHPQNMSTGSWLYSASRKRSDGTACEHSPNTKIYHNTILPGQLRGSMSSLATPRGGKQQTSRRPNQPLTQGPVRSRAEIRAATPRCSETQLQIGPSVNATQP